MDEIEELSSLLIPLTYAKQGVQSLRTRHNSLKLLLTQKKLPIEGWNDNNIEYAISEFSAMDSNNFNSNVGVGEREGRLYSDMVSKRHYSLSHGIGRSGDIAEVQPKAAGSSIIYKLANSMTLHALQLSGLTCIKHCLILPLATGMTMTMTMLSLKKNRPNAKYVIWSRIDQKSCFKAIITAGLIPLILENILVEDDKIETNIIDLKRLIEEYGVDNILCVLTTTSCFAPRQPDKVDVVAKICKELLIPHVINNAYGLQSSIISKLINRATIIGRVDAVIQSTDKNFLVPVGGAIVASSTVDLISSVSSMYPGRASMGPILDMFITLLSMGENGYKHLLNERNRILPILRQGLEKFANRNNEIILNSPGISIGYTIPTRNILCEDKNKIIGSENNNINNNNNNNTKVDNSSFFGAMLFQRNISGCRVISKSSKITKINGYEFTGWGSHISNYPHTYFTAACSIGLTEVETVEFINRLNKTYTKFLKKSSKVDEII